MNPQYDTTADPVALHQPIFRATVVSTPVESGPDGTSHAVAISPQHTDQQMPALITESVRGDVALPTTGSNVLCIVGQNETVYVIGILYSTSDTVSTQPPGTREIGHPESDSTVTFEADGSITVESGSGATIRLDTDGTITLNGGSTAPVTDVSTTKSDGYVSSISLTRADGIFVPSQ